MIALVSLQNVMQLVSIDGVLGGLPMRPWPMCEDQGCVAGERCEVFSSGVIAEGEPNAPEHPLNLAGIEQAGIEQVLEDDRFSAEEVDADLVAGALDTAAVEQMGEPLEQQRCEHTMHETPSEGVEKEVLSF